MGKRQRQQTVFHGRRQVEMLERCTRFKALFIVVDPGLRSSVRMSERPPSNHVRMAFPQTSLGLLCCFETTKEAEGGEGEEKIRKF